MVDAVVTGATGFLGSALCRKLLESGGKVAAVVRKNSQNLNRLPDDPKLILIEGDLDDVGAWQGPLSRFRAEVFYHLAWRGVGNRFRNDEMQIPNIRSSIATLKYAKEIGCKRWIGMGSQAEYGPLDRRISEEDPTEPTTLYGATKLATCHLARIIGREIGIEAVWVRIFSLYGPGDNSGWMLMDVIRQLLDGRRPALTAGEQQWDYLCIDDAVDALLAMGAAGRMSGVYNLGSGRARSIRDVVVTVRDMIDPDLALGFGEIPYRPDQVMHLEANIEKLKRETGWMPATPLEAGIRNLIEFIKSR